jgi:hypothetical protein
MCIKASFGINEGHQRDIGAWQILAVQRYAPSGSQLLVPAPRMEISFAQSEARIKAGRIKSVHHK